ncbi:uncharacterized protein LOC133188169 [Saccostrea echinata]|uniref:uncharacterized protein LOC133188169 n=1 Tax=Saccostrea echinata TaxID=191078 RepID=UPI002A7FDD2B|nr:uncharacterized protein LOC133188169 [Saccostrea echinata]
MKENNRIPCCKKTGSGDVKSDMSTTYSSSVSLNEILSNQSQESFPQQDNSLRNIRQVSVNTIEFMDPPTPQRAGTFPTPVPIASTPGSVDFFEAKSDKFGGRQSPSTNQTIAIASSNIAAASTNDSFAKARFPMQPYTPLQRPKIHNKLLTLDDKHGYAVPEPPKIIRVPVYGKLMRSSIPKIPDPEMQRILDSTLPGAKKAPLMNVAGVGKQPVRKPVAKPHQQNLMSQKPIYDVNKARQMNRSVTFSEQIQVIESHPSINQSMLNNDVKETKFATPLGLTDRIKLLEAQAKEKKKKQFKDSSFDSYNAAPVVNKAFVCTDRERDIKKPLGFTERIKLLEAQAKEKEKRKPPDEILNVNKENRSPLQFKNISAEKLLKNYTPKKAFGAFEENIILSPRVLTPETDRKLLNDVFFSPEDISPIGVVSPTHLEPLCSISDSSLVERILTPTELLATLESKTRLDETKNTELQLTDVQQADDPKVDISPSNQYMETHKNKQTVTSYAEKPVIKKDIQSSDNVRPVSTIPDSAIEAPKDALADVSVATKPKFLKPHDQPLDNFEVTSDISTIEWMETPRDFQSVAIVPVAEKSAFKLEQKIYAFVEETLVIETTPPGSPSVKNEGPQPTASKAIKDTTKEKVKNKTAAGDTSHKKNMKMKAEKSTGDRKMASAWTQKDEVSEFLDKFAPKKYDADIEKLRLEAKDSNKLMMRIQEGTRQRNLKVEEGQKHLDAVKKYHQELTIRKNIQVQKISSMEQAARSAGCPEQARAVIQQDIHLYQRLVEQEAIVCHQINMLEAEFDSLKAMAGIPSRTKPKILRPKPDPIVPILDLPKQEETGLHRGKVQGNRLCRKIPAAVMKVEMPFDQERAALCQGKPKEVSIPVICGQKGMGPKTSDAAAQSNAKLRAKMTGAALLPDMKNNKMIAKKAGPEYANTFKKPGKVNNKPPKVLPDLGNVKMNLYRRND